MARKAIILAGLPGSGKSYFVNQIKGIVHKIAVFDDPIKGDHKNIVEVMKSGQDIIISDPWMCDVRYRNLAESVFKDWNYEITWVFFENDKEKCLRNLAHRNDDRVIERFEAFNYTIPEGVNVKEIWQP
jgi:hypothetical protein